MLKNTNGCILLQRLTFQDTITSPELWQSITGMLYYIRKNWIRGRFLNSSNHFNFPFQVYVKFFTDTFFDVFRKVIYFLACGFPIVYKNQGLLIMNTCITASFSLPSALINKPA